MTKHLIFTLKYLKKVCFCILADYGFLTYFQKHSHILPQKGHSLEVESPVIFLENIENLE